MKKQPNPIPDWRNPQFVYRSSVATDVMKTMKQYGFVPPSEKKEQKQ